MSLVKLLDIAKEENRLKETRAAIKQTIIDEVEYYNSDLAHDISFNKNLNGYNWIDDTERLSRLTHYLYGLLGVEDCIDGLIHHLCEEVFGIADI